jgi:hypothetical protein
MCPSRAGPARELTIAIFADEPQPRPIVFLGRAAAFDEVAAELGRTLDFVKVPKREKAEVLAAFAAHKDEVTAGYVAGAKRG